MDIKKVTQRLDQDNYCHIKNFKDLLNVDSSAIKTFKGYWDRLVLDEKLKSYTHRERRILRYYYSPADKQLSINRNSEYSVPVVYDIDCKPGPNKLTYVEEDFIEHPLVQQLIATDIEILNPSLNRQTKYAIDIHLFRVKAYNEKASPTTSGIHQDGQDFVYMHFIDAQNVQPVISNIYESDSSNSIVFSKPMGVFLETLIVNDKIVYHSASEVKQVLHNQDGYRDILLVAFHSVNS